MNFKKIPLVRAALAIAVLSIFLPGPARADLQQGLVAFWPLDSMGNDPNFGTLTTPDFANSNIMVINGGITDDPSGVPSTPPGLFTNCFSFPNTLSYFTTSGSPTPVTGLPAIKSPNGYTISMWVKAATNTATHYIYTEGSSSSATPILLMQNGNAVANTNKLDILIRNDQNTSLLNHVVSASVVFDNTWHHIAWVDNHGTNALYVDGKLDATSFKYTAAGTFTMNISTIGGLVRNTIAANIFAGQIDNVAIWSRTLSQAEVQQFMSNSIPLPIIKSKPVLQTVSPSSTNSMGDFPTTFTLSVLGSNPITYQWYSNNIPLTDQVSNSLTLNSNSMLIPGTNIFTVTASNDLGTFSTNLTEVVLPDPTNNLAGGLLSYWPLDEIDADPFSTNMITPDIVGHDDFVLGASLGSLPVIAQPGEFTNAMAFDASQGQYAVDRRGVPTYLLTNYSVSMWVNGQPQPQQRVFSESSTNSGNPLVTISTETSGFLPYASIFIRNDAGTVLVNNIHGQLYAFDGNWHHLVWVDQNGYGLLYVDGILDPTSYAYTRTGSLTLNTTSIGAIVRAAPGNFYTGNIDDVALWNRRLTYSEIQQLLTNPPPPPASIMPASIIGTTFQPPDPTNNLYVGDNLTMTVQAGGTQPLHFLWYKNGQPVDTVANPTAASSALLITNAQTSDSGVYSIVVSNSDPVLPGGGVASNIVVTANVQAFSPATNGVGLLVDVDAVGSPNIQPGFVEYNTGLAGVGLTNGIRMTIAGFNGAALADRFRSAAPNITNGPGMTQAQIYNDFIFANSTNAGTGLTITLQHLAPSTTFALTIWSFDPVSGGNRVSDWVDLTSGTPVVIATNYTFNGSVFPVADYQDTITATVTSSAAGTLVIQGVTDTNNTSFGTFLNAIKLVANPAPGPVSITGTGIAADGNFQIITAGQYASQPIGFVYSPALPAASWLPVTNAITVTNSGNTAITEIPISTNGASFFRAAGH